MDVSLFSKFLASLYIQVWVLIVTKGFPKSLIILILANYFLVMAQSALPSKRIGNKVNVSSSTFDAPRLVWDLLLSMPTNRGSIDRVQLVAQTETSSIEVETNVNKPFDEGIMVVDEVRCEGEWISLLDCTCFH
mmetsp:Transcript_22556/g.32727  ORF Transcript_22556/g.32727 Transcript_22556/m.32727 type:complete len:134 (-) Transcript_22556:1466-1867(-)